MTVEEILALPDSVVVQRSTWALFEMRRALLAETPSSREYTQRLQLITEELRGRGALSRRHRR